jgi:hypothetical protein
MTNQHVTAHENAPTGRGRSRFNLTSQTGPASAAQRAGPRKAKGDINGTARFAQRPGPPVEAGRWGIPVPQVRAYDMVSGLG